MASRFAAGQTVALREIWEGRIFHARPVTVVEDTAGRSVLHVPPVVRVRRPEDEHGNELRIPDRDWHLEEREVRHHRILSFAFPRTPYAVLAAWNGETSAFHGWYINLQAPLRRTEVGFDTREHILDVLVAPDRSSWTWKDEDELAEAVAEGLFSPDEADAFRAAGERALERLLLREPPFDEPWEAWRPPAGWDAAGRSLPPAWDLPPA